MMSLIADLFYLIFSRGIFSEDFVTVLVHYMTIYYINGCTLSKMYLDLGYIAPRGFQNIEGAKSTLE